MCRRNLLNMEKYLKLAKVLEFKAFERYTMTHFNFPRFLQPYVLEAVFTALREVASYYNEYMDLNGWPPYDDERMKRAILHYTSTELIRSAFHTYFLSERLVRIAQRL